jgi:hypothetical protein
VFDVVLQRLYKLLRLVVGPDEKVCCLDRPQLEVELALVAPDLHLVALLGGLRAVDLIEVAATCREHHARVSSNVKSADLEPGLAVLKVSKLMLLEIALDSLLRNLLKVHGVNDPNAVAAHLLHFESVLADRLAKWHLVNADPLAL